MAEAPAIISIAGQGRSRVQPLFGSRMPCCGQGVDLVVCVARVKNGRTARRGARGGGLCAEGSSAKATTRKSTPFVLLVLARESYEPRWNEAGTEARVGRRCDESRQEPSAIGSAASIEPAARTRARERSFQDASVPSMVFEPPSMTLTSAPFQGWQAGCATSSSHTTSSHLLSGVAEEDLGLSCLAHRNARPSIFDGCLPNHLAPVQPHATARTEILDRVHFASLVLFPCLSAISYLHQILLIIF